MFELPNKPPRKRYKGINCSGSKLSMKQAREIREEYGKGDTSYAKLAKKYRVDASTIGRIIRKELWVENEN